MKILITGNMGFIGRELSMELLGLGRFDLVGIDNMSTNTEEYYRKLVQSPDIKTYLTSIENAEDYVFEGVDMIIHCAAKARIQRSIGKPREYIHGNVESTSGIIAICDQKKIPLIFISSSSVEAENKLSPYSIGKRLCEMAVKGMDNYKIIRLFNVYGDSMPKTGDNRTLIGAVMDSIETGKSIVQYGNGSKKRDFTYIKDVVKAIIKISLHGKSNKLYRIGTGSNISVRSVLKASGCDIIIQPSKDYEAKETKADIGAIKELSLNLDQNVLSFIENHRREYGRSQETKETN